MKKIITLLLAVVMLFAFAACTSTEDKLDAYITAVSATNTDENMEFVVDGTCLVYSYTLTEDMTGGASAEDLKVLLDEGITTQEALFTAGLEEIKAQVSDEYYIAVEYLLEDGTLITSREFK